MSTAAVVPVTAGARAAADTAGQSQQPEPGAPEWAVVQVANDYAIARPVLEALQEERLVSPPFAATLFSEVQPPVAAYVAPPVWENDPQAAAYLQPRVEALDEAQRAAFDHALSREVALIQGPPGMVPTVRVFRTHACIPCISCRLRTSCG